MTPPTTKPINKPFDDDPALPRRLAPAGAVAPGIEVAAVVVVVVVGAVDRAKGVVPCTACAIKLAIAAADGADRWRPSPTNWPGGSVAAKPFQSMTWVLG